MDGDESCGTWRARVKRWDQWHQSPARVCREIGCQSGRAAGAARITAAKWTINTLSDRQQPPVRSYKPGCEVGWPSVLWHDTIKDQNCCYYCCLPYSRFLPHSQNRPMFVYLLSETNVRNKDKSRSAFIYLLWLAGPMWIGNRCWLCCVGVSAAPPRPRCWLRVGRQGSFVFLAPWIQFTFPTGPAALSALWRRA